jgi:2-methylisocitrate lyase-like PEP mutase family enzyme
MTRTISEKPKPFNLLIGSNSDLTLKAAAALGVRRISAGGALARAAWGGFIHAARAISQGHFYAFTDATPSEQLNAFFRISGEEPLMKQRISASTLPAAQSPWQ